MRGRKPKPTHLKLVEGNPGRRPLNRREPKPKHIEPAAKMPAKRSAAKMPAKRSAAKGAATPKPPAHLSRRAKLVWPRVASMLTRSRILTEADALGLGQLCEAVADYGEAKAELEDFGGLYYETVNQAGGTMHRAHPAVAVMRDADRRIKGWLAEFGMTPSARTRVETPGDEDETDPADQYF